MNRWGCLLDSAGSPIYIVKFMGSTMSQCFRDKMCEPILAVQVPVVITCETLTERKIFHSQKQSWVSDKKNSWEEYKEVMYNDVLSWHLLTPSEAVKLSHLIFGLQQFGQSGLYFKPFLRLYVFSILVISVSFLSISISHETTFIMFSQSYSLKSK